jgi:aldehyde dehydrogenase (NAD+)
MAKKEIKKLDYFTDWKYAPAPEATDHIRLQKQYELFINGKFVTPNSGKSTPSILLPKKKFRA